MAVTYHRDSPPSDLVIENYLNVVKRFRVDLPNEISELQGLITLAPNTLVLMFEYPRCLFQHKRLNSREALAHGYSPPCQN